MSDVPAPVPTDRAWRHAVPRLKKLKLSGMVSDTENARDGAATARDTSAGWGALSAGGVDGPGGVVLSSLTAPGGFCRGLEADEPAHPLPPNDA